MVKFIGPSILLIAISISIFLNEIGTMPALGLLVKDFFETHGLIILPVIVFFEYTYGINFFFPGALTILTAMATTNGNLKSAFFVFIVIWLVSIIGLMTSFFIGRKVENPNCLDFQNKFFYRRIIFSFFSYFHPLTSSIRAYQCGFNRFSIKDYFLEMVFANFFWNLFWGGISYQFGAFILVGNIFSYILLLYSVYWIFSEMRKE